MIYKILAAPVVTYGSETWTLTTEDNRRLELLQMFS